jgi:hypothetical protein
MLTRRAAVVAGIIGALCLAGTAGADSVDTVYITYHGTGAGLSGMLAKLGTKVSSPFIGQDVINFDPNGFAGPDATGLSLSLSGTDPGTNYGPYTRPVYCIEFNQSIGAGSKQYAVYPIDQAPIGAAMTPARASYLRTLFAYYYNQSNLVAGYNQNEEAAAFAACVWEIVNETPGNYDLTSGNFQVHQGKDQQGNDLDKKWITLGQTWLTDLTTKDVPSQMPGLWALVDPTSQDFAIVLDGVISRPVPEPVTMLGLVLSAGSVIGYIRRRKLA